MNNIKEKTEVDIYLKVYDLAPHIDKAIITKLAGFEIEAIWHTSIEVFDNEYYFGNGILTGDMTKGVIENSFIEKIHLGKKHLNKDEFAVLIDNLNQTDWRPGTYNLFEKNCNHFTLFMANTVFELAIPKKYVELSEKAKNHPLAGEMFKSQVLRQNQRRNNESQE